MSAEDLEARYRRLLRAYPKSYRAAREDEIVGVLLDNAMPGQQRPGIGESYDLVTAGLARRFSLRPEAVAASTWSDSLAVVAVLFVMLRAFGLILVPVSAIWFRPPTVGAEWVWRTVNVPSIIGWSLVAMFVWRRHSLAAGLAAFATTFAGFGYHFLLVYGQTDDFFESVRDQTGYLSFTLLAVAVSFVLCQRGASERGLDRLGRLNVGLGALAYAALTFTIAALMHETGWTGRTAPLLMGLSAQAVIVIPVLAAAVAAQRVSLRPVAAMLAAILSLTVVSEATFYYASTYGARPWVYAAEVLALVVVPAVVARFVVSRGKHNERDARDAPMAAA